MSITGQEMSDANVIERVLSDRSKVFDVEWVDPDTATKITFACTSHAMALRLNSILNEIGITVDVP